ncbi:MAG: hypothetical protein GX478_01065 [Erysipelotrichaceae bacterium]|jgi:hypothetical protein|nr:hypothetical protein [Erysipelotrichaceae bacterium]
MKKIKRLILSVSCLALLSGCGQKKTAAAAATQSPEAAATPTPTPSATVTTESLSPNAVTEYDKTAVTALINADLKAYYGAGIVTAVIADNISFSKKDGVITASGEYNYKDGSTVKSRNFTYTYLDRNVDYEEQSKDIGTETSAPKADLPSSTASSKTSGVTSDMTLQDTFDVTISSSITITVSANGDGNVLIQLTDTNGKAVKDLINQAKPVNTEVTETVPAGSYQLKAYTSGGACTFSYRTN